jgi:hypothetical protein
MSDRVKKGDAEAKKITSEIWANIEKQQKETTIKPDLNNYIGTYTDQWFGNIVISIKDGKTYLHAVRSPKLTGEMLYYKANTFVVKWHDRSLDADAFVQFNLDNTGKAESIKMNAISPLTDFSFDFQDLDFKRAK